VAMPHVMYLTYCLSHPAACPFLAPCVFVHGTIELTEVHLFSGRFSLLASIRYYHTLVSIRSSSAYNPRILCIYPRSSLKACTVSRPLLPGSSYLHTPCLIRRFCRRSKKKDLLWGNTSHRRLLSLLPIQHIVKVF
jgi:hypothetical protein